MSDTDQPCCPELERGQIIPAFTLPGADGMPHSPWHYKQREHLLLLFVSNPTGESAQELLRGYARHYAEFREERCAILTITAEPVIVNAQAQEALHLPFPLLADAQATVIPRYTRWDRGARKLSPSIILADRYGAFHQLWLAEDEATLPPINEVMETLQYLNRLCTP